MAFGVHFSDKDFDCKCEGCVQGKCQRMPFKESGSHIRAAQELIHSDLRGPVENKSFAASHYMRETEELIFIKSLCKCFH